MFVVVCYVLPLIQYIKQITRALCAKCAKRYRLSIVVPKESIGLSSALASATLVAELDVDVREMLPKDRDICRVGEGGAAPNPEPLTQVEGARANLSRCLLQ